MIKQPPGNRLIFAMAITSLLAVPWPGMTLNSVRAGQSSAFTTGQSAGRDSSSGSSSQAKPAEKLFARADWIFNHTVETHYKHLHKPPAKQVKVSGSDSCTVDADCSGFVAYLLDQTAAASFAPIRALQREHSYPQAKIYDAFIRTLSYETPSNGWLRVRSYSDLKQGDLIAWEKPLPLESTPDARSATTSNGKTAKRRKRGNTGHVALVAEPAGSVESEESGGKTLRFVPLKVLDCSSVEHFAPQELPPSSGQKHRDGLGKGVVRLILDDKNKVVGYWEGTYSNEAKKQISHPSYTEHIDFARLCDR